MITRICLKNWKSHLDSEFTFTRGVNAIIGIMGSGKTSIVQAMAFALFGTFPALQSRKIVLDDLIMKKPHRKGRAEISVDFQIDGKTYSVKRVLEAGKGTTHAEIREDGRMVEVNPQGVNRIVQDVLQMDYDLFSKAVYSEQNSIDYFLTVPKGQRMQHIDRMLRLDRFEKARENSVSLANRIALGRTEKARFLAELEKENLRERIGKLSEELKELRGGKLKLEKELRGVKDEKERISETVSEFDEMEMKVNRLKVEDESIKSAIREIDENLKSRKGRLKDMEPGDVPRAFDRLEKEIETLEEEIGRVKDGLDEDRNRVASLNAEIKNIKDQLAEMERLGDRCPTCESPITEAKRKKLTDARKGREMVIRNRVNNLARDMEDDKKRVKLLEEQLRERISNREKLASIMDDLDYMKDAEGRRDEYEKRAASIELEMDKTRDRLGRADIKSLRRELQEAVATEREILAKLSAVEDRIGDREDSLQELKDRDEMFRGYRDGMKRDELIAEKLNTFVRVLKATQDQLREEFLKSVNRSMGMIWGELYPYGDYSGIRLAIDKDYVLQIKGSEGWIPVDGMASGGERSIASLALRVAFSMTLVPNLKWLILDEPTHNLDANAIEQFTSVLRERMGSFVEQVFLITHEDRVSEGVLGSLYRLERNKEADGPTRILGI